MYNLRKVYTLMYQDGYVRTIHGICKYIKVYDSEFDTKYSTTWYITVYLNSFGYITVHHWFTFFYPR